MRTLACVTLAMTLAAGAREAAAQAYPYDATSTTVDIGGGGFSYGYWPYGGYGASTAAEGYWRGLGAFYRGLGEYNLFNSLSARNYEEAYSRRLDNKQKYAETYFNMRRLNAAYRKETDGPMPTPETISAVSQARSPDRLAAGSIRPDNGQLNWPLPLQGEEFANARNALGLLFADRAANGGGLGTDNQFRIQRITTIVLDKLAERVGDFSPMEYVAARQFIEGLAVEARIPAGQVAGLASNN